MDHRLRREIDNDELMGKMPVPKAVAIMAVPSVLSSLVTIIYNIADTFFVGQTGDALQVAAVSLTNPIFILMMACSNMLGPGGSAVASMALGAKNEKRAKNVSAFAFYGSLCLGVIIMLILLIFMRPILTLFGANTETYEYARSYMRFISVGAPFIILSATCGHILRVEGASREAMIGNLTGTVTNIVLDPILISGLGLGAGGAAAATTIGNVLASGYYLRYFLKKTRLLSISVRDLKLGDQVASRVCSIGLPSAIISALMSVSTILINQILVAYGNDPVAAIGIVFKLNMFVVFLQSGMANGIQPMLGYNYGAKKRERFEEIEHFTKKTCLLIGCLATALFYFFREPLIRLFINDSAVIGYGVRMLAAYILSGPLIGILFVNTCCLQSVGKALPATILSLLRQGIVLIPMIYGLNALVGLGGVIYAQSFSDLIAIFVSVIIWRKVKGKVWG